MTILIATHRRASEIDRVIDRLRDAEVDFFRLNMGYGESSVELLIGSNGLSTFRASCDDRYVESVEVSLAWYHQPPILDFPRALTDPVGRASVTTSIANFWMGCLSALECDWVNGPDATHRSSNKLVQLLRARRVGLAVPPSFTSNAGASIRREFGSDSPVAKNLADLHQAWGEDEGLAFVTRRVHLGDFDDEGLGAIPALFQHEVRIAREYRVVVVGAQVFASAVETADRAATVDIRLIKGAVNRYEKVVPPAEATEGLRRLLADLGLTYCSADLLESTDGNIYFVDLNPCGSWWWVDDLHDGAVSDALAALLQARST